ncbi:MAG: AI-2E family transporter [Chloroflexi bacterium]|nr:AI-2E family transporter [Chloroflexota bacterium]
MTRSEPVEPTETPPRWPRNRRLILFLVTTALVLALIWQARGALAPFALGLAVAYLIAPTVGRLQRIMPPGLRRRSFSRLLAILLVYGAFLALVAGALLWLVPAVVRQANDLVQNAPALYEQAAAQIDRWLAARGRHLPSLAELSAGLSTLLDQNGEVLRNLVPRLLAFLQDGALTAFGALSSTVSLLLAAVVVPIWLIYILNDTSRVLEGALGLVPRGLRADVEALRIIFDRVLGAYIRGQLIIALILGTLLTLTLTFLGVEYPLLLGFLNGLLGFIPFLGSIIGAVPAVAVALLGGVGLAGKTLLAIILIQQLDGALISPRVQGDSVKLHPALIMVVLVIGQQLLGLPGLLVAVPLTAILRDIVHYIYLRVDEAPPSPAEALTIVGYGDSLTDRMRGGRVGGPADAAGGPSPELPDPEPPPTSDTGDPALRPPA